MSLKKTRGFTLIELLVVIAIIGILSSVVLASLNSARKKGRDARRISDIKQLQLALELYYDANGSTYPVQSAALTAAGSLAATALTGLATTYIPSVPADPKNASPYQYRYLALDSAGAACSVVPCAGYVLRAVLEGAANSSAFIGTVAGDATSCVAGSGAVFPYCVKQ